MFLLHWPLILHVHLQEFSPSQQGLPNDLFTFGLYILYPIPESSSFAQFWSSLFLLQTFIPS